MKEEVRFCVRHISAGLAAHSGRCYNGPEMRLSETATMIQECMQRNQEVLQAYWNLLKLQPRWMWFSWVPS